jgi:DNA (cytosine-5)-methyltransferase 1
MFAGAGGLDLGFIGGFTYLGRRYERLPFQVVRAYDINPRAVATYNANLEPVCEVADITTLEPKDLPQGIDVILGGFPCQDFSFAGKRQGITVHRGRLYLAMVWAVEVTTPKVFVAENVKGLLSANGGLAKEVITNDFANAGPGYRIYMQVLNATDYGVPQRRERVFIVGVRKDLRGEFRFPEPTHHKLGGGPLIPLPKWRTTKEALEDLEDPEVHARLPNAKWDKRKRYPNWRIDRPVDPDAPAPTVLTKQPPFHYKHERRLSVRECARLQSFPDDFVFVAPMSEAYKLVGNAVPPVLAWHLAKAIKDFLERNVS